MERSDERLARVQDLLTRPIKLESIKNGGVYETRVNANARETWETTVLSAGYAQDGTVLHGLGDSSATYRPPGQNGKFPRVYNALLFIARAIQLRNGASRSVRKGTDQDLVDEILLRPVGLPTLLPRHLYQVGSEGPTFIFLEFVPSNDAYLGIDFQNCRIYAPSGSERDEQLYSAMNVLAEAIRLEHEEGRV